MGYIRTAVKIIVIIRIYWLFSQSIVFVFLSDQQSKTQQ